MAGSWVRHVRAWFFSGAALLAAASAHAHEGVHVLGVSAGLGYSFPMDDGPDIEGSGIGGWLEAEYIYRSTDWITPRAYSGILITSPKDDCGLMVAPCDVSAKMLFIGGKLRLMAPIPYVAPFIESGIGASVGTISTKVGERINKSDARIMVHVPFGLGLALGSRHQYELSIQYLFHGAQDQTNGAFAFGVSFPLH